MLILLLFVFVLAIFLGVELIKKVPSQFHTPLMSGSNAISGITIVGACRVRCAHQRASIEMSIYLMQQYTVLIETKIRLLWICSGAHSAPYKIAGGEL